MWGKQDSRGLNCSELCWGVVRPGSILEIWGGVVCVHQAGRSMGQRKTAWRLPDLIPPGTCSQDSCWSALASLSLAAALGAPGSAERV